MIWRRLLRAVPVLGAMSAALAVTALAPSEDAGPTLTFTFEGQSVTSPISAAVLRHRVITPNFDPPLDVRAGRVVFARGGIACDPGEVFVVQVVVTQDGARAEGR